MMRLAMGIAVAGVAVLAGCGGGARIRTVEGGLHRAGGRHLHEVRHRVHERGRADVPERRSDVGQHVRRAHLKNFEEPLQATHDLRSRQVDELRARTPARGLSGAVGHSALRSGNGSRRPPRRQPTLPATLTARRSRPRSTVRSRPSTKPIGWRRRTGSTSAGRRKATALALGLSGRVAQRESARFTRGRSLVRSQPRPLAAQRPCGFRMVTWVRCARGAGNDHPVRTPVVPRAAPGAALTESSPMGHAERRFRWRVAAVGEIGARSHADANVPFHATPLEAAGGALRRFRRTPALWLGPRRLMWPWCADRGARPGGPGWDGSTAVDPSEEIVAVRRGRDPGSPGHPCASSRICCSKEAPSMRRSPSSWSGTSMAKMIRSQAASARWRG